MLALLLRAAVPGLGATSLPLFCLFPNTLTTSKIYLSCPHVSAFFLKGKPS